MQVIPSEHFDLIKIIVVAVLVWTIPWRAMALWKSARRGQVGWFIFFILIQTGGLLEIIYLVFLSKVKVKNIDYKNNPNHNKMRYATKRKIV
ncbi:MAG: hypothetical protein GF332_00955 [Candidatus Moranbacteria bacterium]|nr:hypothetical protein [Candidatus Moranbacteria bacterium]